jgi:hypothetical protein
VPPRSRTSALPAQARVQRLEHAQVIGVARVAQHQRMAQRVESEPMPICSVPPSRTSALAYRPMANSASLTGWRGSANSFGAGPRHLDHDVEEVARHLGRAADVRQGRDHLGHQQRARVPRRAISSSKVEAQVGIAAQAQVRPSGEQRHAVHQHVDVARRDRCARRGCS